MEHGDNALGEFLRARRSLLDPADFAVLDHGQRRVEGLRREELAFLAGVSTHYYARLEQGRARHPSRAVLDSLARALELGDEAKKHLHALAEDLPLVKVAARRNERVSPELLRLLDRWSDQPVAVIGRYRDVLTSTPLAQALNPGFAPGHNLLYEAFLSPAGEGFYVDWEIVAAGAVAGLRSSAGSDLADPQLKELVDELSRRSPEFRRIWARHDVQERTSGTKRYLNPLVGPLTLEYQTFRVNEAPDQTLFVFFAETGSVSEQALVLLASCAELSDANRG
ncbi:helix-turn-helix domain-containing protein [Subtercola boreus]|uniref:HTH cro/C1-type domain-containing protein n=1 Tax=Subtercola boreus TaxID=120213 RepID=A0A3E0W868_9MICO|nr:helix-turn-helix transcriptional regulator [Subtercola boreus]RFA18230.1 hypothetical protein B7R23_14320 [Subtercola boreus]RFA18622.1 hypothetical protein B7R24_14280 [Subtercola boreus]RFA25226.1 hypothetical protein B7R25_14315 [Subtercola boreus]